MVKIMSVKDANKFVFWVYSLTMQKIYMAYDKITLYGASSVFLTDVNNAKAIMWEARVTTNKNNEDPSNFGCKSIFRRFATKNPLLAANKSSNFNRTNISTTYLSIIKLTKSLSKPSITAPTTNRSVIFTGWKVAAKVILKASVIQT